MVEILVDYSREALTDAVNENWWEWIRLSAETPYYTFIEKPEYSIVYFHSNSKVDQAICIHLNTTPERCESTINKIYSAFEEHGLPVMIMLTPKSGPDEIETHLETKGLSRIVGNPAMAADLQELKQGRPSPEDLSIERIKDNSGMDLFREIYYEGFEENRGFLDCNVNSCKMLGYDTDFPIRSYIGYLGDEPIATSQLVFRSGVAGLFSVVVLPKVRGRGLGTAMTLDTLRLGVKEGYRFGVLWATPMGINIYRKIGFKELFKPVIYATEWDH